MQSIWTHISMELHQHSPASAEVRTGFLEQRTGKLLKPSPLGEKKKSIWSTRNCGAGKMVQQAKALAVPA